MRRFESSRPSPAFPQFAVHRGLCRKARIFRALAGGAASRRLADIRIRSLSRPLLLLVSGRVFPMSGIFEIAADRDWFDWRADRRLRERKGSEPSPPWLRRFSPARP